MAETPIYKRQVGGEIKPQGITPSTGAIRNLEMISKNASQMAQGFQHEAEKIYLTEFQNNALDQIAKIAERNPTNPEQMAQEFEAAYAGLSKSASPLLQEKLKLNFQLLTRPQISQAMELKTKIANDKLKETSLVTLNESLKGLEKNAALLLSNNSSVAYDASQAAQVQMMNMRAAIEQTDAKGVPLFSAEQRVKYIENANSQMVITGIKGWFDQQGDKNSAMKAILSGQKTFKFYDIDGNLTSEKVPYDELDVHSFDKIKNYMEAEVKHQFAEVARAQKETDINSFFDGDRYIDPNNKKQLKALNTYFDKNIVPQLAGMDEAQKTKTIVDFIAQSHIVPSGVKGMIRENTRHGTVAQKAWNANLISKIKEVNRYALNDFADADITYANALASKLRYGLTEQQAVDRVDLEFDPDKKDVIKIRREAAKKEMPVIADAIKEALGEAGRYNNTYYPDDKEITDTMTADYRNIFEQEYVRCGDPVIARESADSIIRKMWSVTKINGRKEIMPFAPEKYYNVPNTDNSWIRGQLVEKVKSIESYKDINEDNIGIVADSLTERDAKAKQPPAYKVTIKTPQGYEIARDKDGDILYIRFDAIEEAKKQNERVAREKAEKVMFDRHKREIVRAQIDYYRNNNPAEINDINRTLGLDLMQ